MALAGRAFAVWLVIIAAETLHGIARTLWLAPIVGGFRARQIAVFSGSAIILMVTAIFIRWLCPPTRRAALANGGLWLALTLAFEIGLGRATGASWDRITEDYDPRRGGLLAIGTLVLVLSPLVAARLRGVAPWSTTRHEAMRVLVLILACSVVAVADRPAGVIAASEWREPHTRMRFVLVPAGRFVMGSAESEPGRAADEIPHEVVIATPFHLGAFEVTQQQWQSVMGTTPSRFHGDPARPVENVNELEVQDFLRRLTARSSDSRFRLPTEAEWEYACRAGTTTAFHVGATLDATQARIDPRRPDDATGPPASGGPARVGSFAPNAWGLHDMHGNVWEWTDDAYCPYAATAVADPRQTCRGPLKVIRGGSWYFRADSARCATRYTHRPADRGFSLGFRVLREVGPR